jgi:predicted nucleic acid-binding Zn ribbon protein
MSDQVCKWCGKPIFGEVQDAAGWAVCSEKCRQQLDASVREGKTEAKKNLYTPGCLALLAVVVFLIYGIYSVFTGPSRSPSAAPAQTQQGFDDAPRTRHSEPEAAAAAQEPVEEAAPKEDTSDPNVVEEAPKPEGEPAEPVEPVEPVAQ